jgi:hypothetical protein
VLSYDDEEEDVSGVVPPTLRTTGSSTSPMRGSSTDKKRTAGSSTDKKRMAALDLALGTSISWGPHRGGPPPPSPEDYVCYSATFDSILEFGFPIEDSLTTPLIWTEMGRFGPDFWCSAVRFSWEQTISRCGGSKGGNVCRWSRSLTEDRKETDGPFGSICTNLMKFKFKYSKWWRFDFFS